MINSVRYTHAPLLILVRPPSCIGPFRGVLNGILTALAHLLRSPLPLYSITAASPPPAELSLVCQWPTLALGYARLKLECTLDVERERVSW